MRSVCWNLSGRPRSRAGVGGVYVGGNSGSPTAPGSEGSNADIETISILRIVIIAREGTAKYRWAGFRLNNEIIWSYTGAVPWCRMRTSTVDESNSAQRQWGVILKLCKVSVESLTYELILWLVMSRYSYKRKAAYLSSLGLACHRRIIPIDVHKTLARGLLNMDADYSKILQVWRYTRHCDISEMWLVQFTRLYRAFGGSKRLASFLFLPDLQSPWSASRGLGQTGRFLLSAFWTELVRDVLQARYLLDYGISWSADPNYSSRCY